MHETNPKFIERHISPNIEIIQVHSTLYEIKNVFTQDYLDLIDTRLEYGFLWNMDRKLQRLSHSGIEENVLTDKNAMDPFYHAGAELEPLVSKLANEKLSYRIAKLFLDLPGSEVPRHHDNNDIAVMLQVYLYASGPKVPGTCFLEPMFNNVDFEYNCGYININTDKKYHLSPTVHRGYRSSIGYQFIYQNTATPNA